MAAIAVVYFDDQDYQLAQQLAQRLSKPLLAIDAASQLQAFDLFLGWQAGRLSLFDHHSLGKTGLAVNFDVRHESQRSWPAPKKGPLAQAIGRKTETVLDATCGWGQDSFFIFRMGYRLSCMERSLVMHALLQDGFERLNRESWMQSLQLETPRLILGDAITALSKLTEKPDCIYLDPMFPPKRKKSALAKKSMTLLRPVLGDDPDRGELFNAAMAHAGKRVVVKNPEYAEPLAEKCDFSFTGKLVRYDVYFKV